jgi:hypothetical protein
VSRNCYLRMRKKDGWYVTTYTDYFYKIVHEVATREMAKEHVEKIFSHGDFHIGEDGLETHIPPSRIMKVTIAPPGSDISSAKVYVR